jgi:hypothetical protein
LNNSGLFSRHRMSQAVVSSICVKYLC